MHPGKDHGAARARWAAEILPGEGGGVSSLTGPACAMGVVCGAAHTCRTQLGSFPARGRDVGVQIPLSCPLP